MNVAAVICVAVGHAKVRVFPAVLLAVPAVPPLRVDFTGVIAVPIIPEIIHLGVNPKGAVIRQQTPTVLLRPVFKRF